MTFGISRQGRPADAFLSDSVRWAWRTRIKTGLALDIRMRLWQEAEKEAVRVFAANLRDLLLAAPAGGRATLGLDPGFRTGVKVAVVDRTGKFVDHATIYPHEPARQWNESMLTLAQLCVKHRIELVAIGNGTASRETEKLVNDLMKLKPDLKLTKAIVSEAGASVYSASGVRLEGISRSRRVDSRRGFDRAPAAGSARRARQGAAGLDRRRPVSARSQPARARARARCHGGGLRQRGRRRSQYRFGAAARARLGHRREPGAEHRRPSRLPMVRSRAATS